MAGSTILSDALLEGCRARPPQYDRENRFFQEDFDELNHAVEGCWRIVDLAMDLSGGFGMFKKNEMERLFRDARAGRFHPANSALTHEIVAKTALGIDLDEMPRWG